MILLYAVDPDAIDADGLGDVLQPLLAARFERERDLLPDLIDDRHRYADTTALGDLLQSRRNIDRVAMAILALDDHIADMDANPEVDSSLRGLAVIASSHATLDRRGALDRIDHAAELDQQPVARQLENAAMMIGDDRLDQFFPMRTQPLKCAGLVATHQRAITGNIGNQNGGEPAFHARSPGSASLGAAGGSDPWGSMVRMASPGDSNRDRIRCFFRCASAANADAVSGRSSPASASAPPRYAPSAFVSTLAKRFANATGSAGSSPWARRA
jgi:hypothetical protein